MIRLACIFATLACIFLVTQSKAANAPRFPRSEEVAFINACMSHGGQPARCACALRYLEAHYSYTQLNYIVNHQPFRYAKIVAKIAQVC